MAAWAAVTLVLLATPGWPPAHGYLVHTATTGVPRAVQRLRLTKNIFSQKMSDSSRNGPTDGSMIFPRASNLGLTAAPSLPDALASSSSIENVNSWGWTENSDRSHAPCIGQNEDCGKPITTTHLSVGRLATEHTTKRLATDHTTGRLTGSYPPSKSLVGSVVSQFALTSALAIITFPPVFTTSTDKTTTTLIKTRRSVDISAATTTISTKTTPTIARLTTSPASGRSGSTRSDTATVSMEKHRKSTYMKHKTTTMNNRDSGEERNHGVSAEKNDDNLEVGNNNSHEAAKQRGNAENQHGDRESGEQRSHVEVDLAMEAGRTVSSRAMTNSNSPFTPTVAHHFTGFVQHVWLPNSTPRSPGPIEDGPLGSILWRDKKYLVSIMIPIAVGFGGAMMIIVMAYASRAWKKRREIREHRQRACGTFLEAAASKTDDLAPLHEISDDEF